MHDAGFHAPKPSRFGALAVVGVIHLLVIVALLNNRVPAFRSLPLVVEARVIPQVEPPRPAPPMSSFPLRPAAAPRIDLPPPEIRIEDVAVVPVSVPTTAARESAGIAAVVAEPAATARFGPPEIQNVQYARPIMLQYPPASRRLNETGVVLVRVLIDEYGVPIEVLVQRSSGHARLDSAAIAAVRRALFRPYRENGVAMPAQALVPIRFELG
jgi:protein TonB